MNVVRITTEHDSGTVILKLEGRLAGLYVKELSAAWLNLAPTLKNKKLAVDLRDMTFADVEGAALLRQMYQANGAEFLANTPLTRYFAEQARHNHNKQTTPTRREQ